MDLNLYELSVEADQWDLSFYGHMDGEGPGVCESPSRLHRGVCDLQSRVLLQ